MCDCNDKSNLKGYNPNSNLSGSFKYDGQDFDCVDDSLDVSNGEPLNSVISKLLNKVCLAVSGRTYLAHTSLDNNLSESVGVSQTLDLFEFVDVNNIKDGEMIKIKYSGSLSTVVGTGGLSIKARVYGKDSAGLYTSPVNFISQSVAAGQTIVDQFVYYIYVTKVSNTILHFSIDGETRLGSINKQISNNNVAMADLSSHELVLDFTAQRSDAGDTFALDFVSMEHIRP